MTLDKLFNNTKLFLKRVTANYITASLLLFTPLSCGNSNRIDELYPRDNMGEMDQNSGIEYGENKSEFDGISLEAESVTDSNQNEYCQNSDCVLWDIDTGTDYLEPEPVPDVADIPLETICSPNCWYKNCGDDGCGGSCGSCFPGYTCKNGNCLEY